MEKTKEEKIRTIQQNKSLHLYFTQLAETLNDAGLDMRKVLRPSISIPWTSANVKEFLWKPIMDFQLQKSSTTEMTTKEIDQVYDTINRHLGETFGIHVEWPSLESLINNSRINS
jgi:hypothetical protein